MHVAIVTETFPPDINGVAMTLSRWVGGLLERDCTITLIRPYPAPGSDESAAFDIDSAWRGSLNRVHVRGFPIPRYPELRFGLPAGRTLSRLWHQVRPDVIYIATEGPLGRSALNVARRMAIPALSGFHTNFHSYSRHYGFGFLNKLILAYLRRFHNRSSGTLVPTPALAQELRDLHFENVHVLSRGVDSTLFHPAKRNMVLRRQWGANEEDTVALYVGRLAPEKNIPLAVAAFREMKKRHPRAQLVMVGDGPMHEMLARDNPDVHLCGVHTGEALAELYASCDLFLFPSETETFGNVVLEAMSSGLAVVAFNDAAARIHISDAHSGRLVSPGDEAGFIETAAELAGQTELLAQYGQAARHHAEAYDWKRIVDQLHAQLQLLTAGEALCSPAV